MFSTSFEQQKHLSNVFFSLLVSLVLQAKTLFFKNVFITARTSTSFDSFVAVGIKSLHDNLSKEEPFEKVKANPKQYY
jgi:hypothetical protein